MEEWRELDLSQLNLDPGVTALLGRLLAHIEVLEARIIALEAENQALRDENNRLKGQKGRPEFKANQPPRPREDPVKKPRERRTAPPAKPRRERIEMDRTEVVTLARAALPDDFQPLGYREVVVQNLRFERDSVVYRLERGRSARTGQFYEARLPDALQGSGYGPELHAFVLLAYFELRVPEEKILRLLRAQGIIISAGTVSALISRKHLTAFAEERAAILEAGLQSTRYQQLDDTGLRVAFEQRTLRHVIPILVTDGASQFRNQTLYQALCWIHEERHYAKMWLSYPAHRQRLEEQRRAIWAFYERLKAYARDPTEHEKETLWRDFDALFEPNTGSIQLDDRLRLTRAKKELLLLVLDFPEVPLENNRAERDLREVVVKRKISSGPRTPDGAQAWEVFFTVLTTCSKQGVNFFAYLLDRISGACQMPPLADLVRAHAPTGS